MQLRVIILLIFALLVAIFAVMNTQLVEIDFLLGQTEVKLVFVILLSILIGALFIFILSSMKQIKLSRRIKTLEKENSKLNNELKEYKDKVDDNNEAEEKQNESLNNVKVTQAEEQ